MNSREGAWIFVSHSNKDWDEVRRVRNRLEENGHKPLLFFLKCLSDGSELDGLIKREIEARDFFLLCDSENARRSKHVQDEVAYIRQLEGKAHETVDLTTPFEAQVERIDRLCKRATVFLSYSREDQSFAKRMQDALLKHDYSVWIGADVPPDSDWRQALENGIDRAVERGFVLILLSRHSAGSPWVQYETEYALNKAAEGTRGGNIIPILVDHPLTMGSLMARSSMPTAVHLLLDEIGVDFSRGDFDVNMEKLIRDMKRRAMD